MRLFVDATCSEECGQTASGGNIWDYVRRIRDGVAGYVARDSVADEVLKKTAGAFPLARKTIWFQPKAA